VESYISHISTYHGLDQDSLICFMVLIYLALKFYFMVILWGIEKVLGCLFFGVFFLEWSAKKD